MYDWKLLSRSFCRVRLVRNHCFWATPAALLQNNPSYSPHCHRPLYLETPINAIISYIRTGTNILQLRIVNVRIEYGSKSEDNSIRIRTHEYWPSSKRLSKPCLQPDTSFKSQSSCESLFNKDASSLGSSQIFWVDLGNAIYYLPSLPMFAFLVRCLWYNAYLSPSRSTTLRASGDVLILWFVAVIVMSNQITECSRS